MTASQGTASVDVILPCLDEALALPWVFGRMPPGYRAILADNGSTDRSADIARSYGATVVAVPQRGFGAACHAGLLTASADVVCFLDADASLDPQQLPRVADLVLSGEADLALGRRRPTTRGAWPLHGRVGNALFARELRRRSGVRVHDLGPMRAARRQPLLDLQLQDRRSGYALEMVAAAGRAGWRVTEVDVDYSARTGRSKVTGSVRGTWTALHDMREVLSRVADRPAS